MTFSGVYVIRNKINKRAYVGSSCDLAKRLRAHIGQLNRGVHHSVSLQRAWAKYGESSFEFIIVEFSEPTRLVIREQDWIELLHSNDGRHGYNIRKTAEANSGLRYKQRNRCSKRKPFSAEHRQHISESLKGTKHSSERIEKMRCALTGRKASPEQIKNAANAMRGKKHSAQRKQHIADGVRRSWETRDRTISDEQRHKLSLANRRNMERGTAFIPSFAGRTHSPEECERISERNRRRWAAYREKKQCQS